MTSEISSKYFKMFIKIGLETFFETFKYSKWFSICLVFPNFKRFEDIFQRQIMNKIKGFKWF